MKKFFKFFGYLLLATFIVIQFFRPAKNNSIVDARKQITAVMPVPENVQTIFAKACNDCHSNNTVYPWYSHIQPVAWWLSDHIKDGKKHLNFDEYATYRPRKQFHKMEETTEMVKEGAMPLESYTVIHKNAKLTQEEKVTITNWAQMVMDSLKRKYPIDSLIKKK